MAVRIRITRGSNNQVQFETVTVPDDENVFFVNLDTLAPHQPSILPHVLPKAPPSPPSIAVVPHSPYFCLIHAGEQGIINIVPALTSANTNLAPATMGQPIDEQQLVTGGKSPYQVMAEAFEVFDAATGAVIHSGSGIGPGLQLIVKPDDAGICVSGTPTVSGIYKFTFSINDAMGGNLEQIECEMVVA